MSFKASPATTRHNSTASLRDELNRRNPSAKGPTPIPPHIHQLLNKLHAAPKSPASTAQLRERLHRLDQMRSNPMKATSPATFGHSARPTKKVVSRAEASYQKPDKSDCKVHRYTHHQPKVVVLRDGSKAPEGAVITTRMSLQRLQETCPYALHDLVETCDREKYRRSCLDDCLGTMKKTQERWDACVRKCQDAHYTIGPNPLCDSRSLLQDYGLMDPQGDVHNLTRQITLNSTTGEGPFGLRLISPIRPEKPGFFESLFSSGKK